MELKMNIRSNTPVNFGAIRKPFKPYSQTFKDKIQKELVEDYLQKNCITASNKPDYNAMYYNAMSFKDEIQKGLVEDYLWKAGVQDVL